VRREPGSEKTYTAAGGPITKTKDFYSLEDQVSDIIFLASGGGNKDE
jgi:phospholipid/cholesterol/gamma-HCH transport system substrate-binding protein